MGKLLIKKWVLKLLIREQPLTASLKFKYLRKSQTSKKKDTENQQLVFEFRIGEV